MAFGDFDIPTVLADFGLSMDMTQSLFANVAAVPISSVLAGYLSMSQPLGATHRTEKGRSEFVVSPMFAELWNRSGRSISVLSGAEFNVDVPAGLVGSCDFALCRSRILHYITAPVLVVAEAKRDDVAEGLGQCAAEMVAAQRFNERANTPVDAMYGCATTGVHWKFMRLVGTHLQLDIDDYHINQPDRILGVLLHCCGVTPTAV